MVDTCPRPPDHGRPYGNHVKGSALRFTRLRLNGFKSFVDPTDLVIADGLTGVVGPNGCGKSNLLEALRWVMGENRPTAMRGGGMEDVIFAGAASRPARNFAEVSADHRQRRAAGAGRVQRSATRWRSCAGSPATPARPTRRTPRTCGRATSRCCSPMPRPARIRPALVRQGQIAELINAKPKNRRRILEEAAGISGLYQRRHEAELQLGGDRDQPGAGRRRGRAACRPDLAPWRGRRGRRRATARSARSCAAPRACCSTAAGARPTRRGRRPRRR